MRSQKEAFDAKAKSYEGGRLGGWYKAQGEMILERARLRSGQTVLDVGCASGWLLRQLGHRFSGITGLGVDLSARMVELARERTRVEAVPGLSYITADWMNADPRLLLEANGLHQADLVTCVSTFHYFSDPVAALSKMHQVTAPGGRLLLLDRARDSSPATWLWDFVHRVVLHDTERFYGSAELVEMAEAAGYKSARVVRVVKKLFWKGKLSTSLALVSAVR